MTQYPKPKAQRWNVRRAQALPGKIIVIGLTMMLKGGGERLEQLWGVVKTVDREKGVSIALSGKRAGKTWLMPPDFRSLSRLPKGDFILKTTGERVANPDYFASFTVDEP